MTTLQNAALNGMVVEAVAAIDRIEISSPSRRKRRGIGRQPDDDNGGDASCQLAGSVASHCESAPDHDRETNTRP
jgi:hypothetical protein